MFLISETGEKRQVLLYKLMLENSFFYRKIIDHRTNKNTADDNCFQITISWFGIQWVSMYKFSYFANKALPHTRYRLGQDFGKDPYLIVHTVLYLTKTIATNNRPPMRLIRFQ